MSSTTPFRWNRLPVEIRHLVLEQLHLMSPGRDTLATPLSDFPRWKLIKRSTVRSQYAAVNREFQHFFEAINFNNILISQEHLDEFKKIVSGQNRCRLGYIRRLWLRFILPEYGCDDCQTAESRETQTTNNALFTRALIRLLDILSQWKRKDALKEHRAKGMVLELSAHSPSDVQHHWRHLFPLREDYPYRPLDDHSPYIEFSREDKEECGSLTDEFHHIEKGDLRLRNVPHGARARLFGRSLLDFNFRNCPLRRKRRTRTKLPQVELVTGLCFRRQFYRSLRPVVVGRLMKESFPCIQKLNYEFWYQNVGPEHLHERELPWFLLYRIPATLKKLTLFRDFNLTLNGQQYWDNYPAASDLIGGILAIASRNLEVLASSWITDAKDFLKPYDKEFFALHGHKTIGGDILSWPNLHSLALTATDLHPSSSHGRMNRLLLFAARAAMKMPKLTTMELWNSGGWKPTTAQACVFRYHCSKKDGPTITWCSTWPDDYEFVLNKGVISAWREVAETHARRTLTVQHIQLGPKELPIYGPFIKWRTNGALTGELMLDNEILENISQFQIELETLRRPRATWE
ncbi:hypothetical protein QBC40DRAFT_235024 [Triangularia verruculosa]|uniref:DUF6546 domain-containing protein n=1 Tax=Triangularia verruculosa TaxID=2587418 RepID=A0AAN6XE61_9PEZI|nr:hypothetical protein QBC40DRAFT_235024 [Triangularia verruculosa]